jgi:hypothetical protein
MEHAVPFAGFKSDTVKNMPNAKRIFSGFELSLLQGLYDSLEKFRFAVILEFRAQYGLDDFDGIWEISAEDFTDFLAGSLPFVESEIKNYLDFVLSLANHQ